LALSPSPAGLCIRAVERDAALVEKIRQIGGQVVATKTMRGCAFFMCNSCSKLRLIKEQNIEKAAYTTFLPESEKKLIYEIHHIQICDNCKEKAGKK